MKMVDYIYVQALSLKNYENDDTTLYIYIYYIYIYIEITKKIVDWSSLTNVNIHQTASKLI